MTMNKINFCITQIFEAVGKISLVIIESGGGIVHVSCSPGSHKCTRKCETIEKLMKTAKPPKFQHVLHIAVF